MRLNLLIGLLILFSGVASANRRFVDYCENPRNEKEQYEVEYLKLIFREHQTCRKLVKTLSSLRSFTEFIPSQYVRTERDMPNFYSWTNEMRWLEGMTLNYTGEMSTFSSYVIFDDLTVFSEFKNLQHMNLRHDGMKRNQTICDVVKSFPHLKMVTLTPEDLYQDGVDDCLSSANIEVIIQDSRYVSSSDFPSTPKSKVIGIDKWSGNLKGLSKLKHLQYLDIAKGSVEDGGFEYLARLQDLTHFSLNTEGIKNFKGLGLLVNLEFLSLTCTSSIFTRTPVVCDNPYATDLKFLEDLPWLKHLNLSFNSFKDLQGIESLEYLETLSARGNNIEHIPALSSLKNLRKLDLADNEIKDVSFLAGSQSLKTLNLAGNKIKDFSFLRNLKNLTHLNISRNTYQEKLSLPPLPSLLYLAVNGFQGNTSEEDESTRDMIHKTFRAFRTGKKSFQLHSADEKDEIYRILFSSPVRKQGYVRSCDPLVTIGSFPDLSGFPKLLGLSVSSQKLKVLPEIKNGSLHYLDISFNDFSSVGRYQEKEDHFLATLNISQSGLEEKDLLKLPEVGLLIKDSKKYRCDP